MKIKISSNGRNIMAGIDPKGKKVIASDGEVLESPSQITKYCALELLKFGNAFPVQEGKEKAVKQTRKKAVK